MAMLAGWYLLSHSTQCAVFGGPIVKFNRTYITFIHAEFLN